MNYNNINKDTTIVLENGMGNTYESATYMQNTIQKSCLIEVLNFVISRGANRLILLSDIKCKFAVSHAKNCSSSK